MSKLHRLRCHKRQQCRTILLLNFVLSTKSKQIEHVQFVSTLTKGRNFVRHCCRNRQHCCQKTATMSKKHSTPSKESFNLWHSTMLLRHFCWYGRSFTGWLALGAETESATYVQFAYLVKHARRGWPWWCLTPVSAAAAALQATAVDVILLSWEQTDGRTKTLSHPSLTSDAQGWLESTKYALSFDTSIHGRRECRMSYFSSMSIVELWIPLHQSRTSSPPSPSRRTLPCQWSPAQKILS